MCSEASVLAVPTAHAAHLLCCASTVFDQPSARVRVRLDAERALSSHSCVLYAAVCSSSATHVWCSSGARTVVCGNVCASDLNACVVCMSLIVHCCARPPETHANGLGAQHASAGSGPIHIERCLCDPILSNFHVLNACRSHDNYVCTRTLTLVWVWFYVFFRSRHRRNCQDVSWSLCRGPQTAHLRLKSWVR